MSPAEINIVASLIPRSLKSDSDILDYVLLFICPALNIRPAEVDAAFPEILRQRTGKAAA